MGQMEVMKVLEKKNKALTTKEISKILKANCALVNRALKKLYDQGAVSRRVIKTNMGYYPYQYQIK